MWFKLLLFLLDVALVFLISKMIVTGRELSRKLRPKALVLTHKWYARAMLLLICSALMLIEALRIGKINGFDFLLMVHISFGILLLISSFLLNFWMNGFRSKNHAKWAYFAALSCVGTVVTSIPIVIRI